EREEIVSGAHAGFGDNVESKALGTYELANKGVLLKNKASGSNLKPYVKRQFTSLSTPTSPLPAATPTTGNSFSPTTPITYNGSNSPDEDITVAGESGPPEAVFNPTDLTWRKLQCSRLGLPAPEKIPDRQSREYLGPPEATDSILGDGNCFIRAVSLEITGSREHHEELRVFTVSFL
ncbi:otu family cysteine protease, partial [Plakobranchus ocellatus]